MLISFEIEEMRNFPDEVRSFLNQYIQNKVSDKKPNDEQYNAYGNSYNNYEDSPLFTKNLDRRLVSSDKFDWFSMFKTEIDTLRHDWKHDFCYTIKPDNSTSVLFNEMGGVGELNHNDPKTWGMALIFCCMFGFGGEFPGLRVAKTTKEIAENIKTIGLSGENLISSKTVGPLLKTITSTFRLYAAKFLDGTPDSKLHWFNFTSKTNEFYFAGETDKICYEVAGKLAREFFLLSEEEFKKIEKN